MTRTLFWLFAITMYWSATIEVIRKVSPVFWDGNGPMPSFSWTRLPAHGLRDYFLHERYYEFVYFLPYAEASAVITCTGCFIAPRILRQLRPRSPNAFLPTTTITLAVLVLEALLSDVGDLLRLWFVAPRFFLHGNFSTVDLLVLARFFLPPSLLAGAIAVARRVLEIQ
jgi:hypothetical protein